jgi:hypothetical protein
MHVHHLYSVFKLPSAAVTIDTSHNAWACAGYIGGMMRREHGHWRGNARTRVLCGVYPFYFGRLVCCLGVSF